MNLSEKEIGRLALNYLREYYRYRERHPDGFFEIKTNQVTQSGIIADGLIRFKQVDKSVFESTVEATSMAKEEEIRYRRLDRLLVIDALTIGLLFSAVLMAYLYFSRFLESYLGRYFAFWSMAFWGMLAFGVVAWLLLSRLHRYRYIYSIEQFRQYAVDEQWIAYDVDIFPGYKNKYLEELKAQCLKWGIGILKIENNQVYPLMTPSRDSNFQNRQKVDFFQEGTMVPKLLSPKDFLKQINKFRRGSFNKIFIVLFATGLLSYVFYQFHLESPVDYWEVEDLERRAEIDDELGPEINEWVAPEFVIPFNDKVKPYLNRNVTIFVKETTDATHRSTPKVLVLTDNDLKRFQPMSEGESCKGIPGSRSDDFIIQLGAYRSKSNAKRRVKLLNEVGITADIYNCGCLGSTVKLHCVIYVHAYVTPESGFQKMNSFKRILENGNIPVEEIWLRSVREL